MLVGMSHSQRIYEVVLVEVVGVARGVACGSVQDCQIRRQAIKAQ